MSRGYHPTRHLKRSTRIGAFAAIGTLRTGVALCLPAPLSPSKFAFHAKDSTG